MGITASMFFHLAVLCCVLGTAYVGAQGEECADATFIAMDTVLSYVEQHGLYLIWNGNVEELAREYAEKGAQPDDGNDYIFLENEKRYDTHLVTLPRMVREVLDGVPSGAKATKIKEEWPSHWRESRSTIAARSIVA